MTARNQNFTMFAGDSKNVNITVSNVDLAGCTVKWGVKKTVYDEGFALYKATGGGITQIGTDTLVIALKPEDTAEMSGDYQHESEITDALGNVSTILTGKMSVERSGV